MGKFILPFRLLGMRKKPLYLGRYKFRDAQDNSAFQFRMPGGIPGDINRTHPVSVPTYLNDTTTPVNLFGGPALATSSNTVRGVTGTDTGATTLFGIVARPYPTQQSSGQSLSNTAFGNSTPPAGFVDIVKSGFIMVNVNGGPVNLTSTVYIWTAAPSGAHVTGGFETTNPAGSGISVSNSNTYYNGPADANGNVELAFNI